PRSSDVMRHRRSIVAAFLAGLLTAACETRQAAPAAKSPSPPPAAAPAANATLYQRLGGYDALAAVTDDFLSRMLGDPKMAAYFEHVDDKGKKRLRQMIVDQLCSATGGPCVYVGADMPTAHKDLHISEKAWGV